MDASGYKASPGFPKFSGSPAPEVAACLARRSSFQSNTCHVCHTNELHVVLQNAPKTIQVSNISNMKRHKNRLEKVGALYLNHTFALQNLSVSHFWEKKCEQHLDIPTTACPKSHLHQRFWSSMRQANCTSSFCLTSRGL